MNRLTHERCSGIKTGYWSAAKKDELIDRLAEYENTGLEPEEIKRRLDPDNSRPHGRWVETNWAEYDGHGEVITFSDVKALKCTNCCNCFKKGLLWRKNYCPNCGAKMIAEDTNALLHR